MTFLPLQSPNVMQKIRKILRAVSEKTALPTNLPINQLFPTTPILLDLADTNPKKTVRLKCLEDVNQLVTKNIYLNMKCLKQKPIFSKPQCLN